MRPYKHTKYIGKKGMAVPVHGVEISIGMEFLVDTKPRTNQIIYDRWNSLHHIWSSVSIVSTFDVAIVDIVVQ